MIAVKQELLAGLAAELEKRVPGAGARAAFETPKSAAHGDLASNAAMQLAKPLKLNPRQLAESLKTALMAQASYQRWVEAIDIAGPGFINFRLQPAARQQVVREVLEAAMCGQAPAVELLLSLGANPRLKNEFCQTANDVAVLGNKAGVAEIFQSKRFNHRK